MDRLVGSNIDHYSIVQKLGEGGMGKVYLAHDPRLNRNVALKLLSNIISQDASPKERFEREAKMIAQLEHPAIIPVYEFGEHNDQPYLTMRFMRGGTLTDRLADRSLSPFEASQILQRICGALDKAHENKIIHRDVKPANILFDEDGRAYLGDFGIARLTEGAQTMTIIGTPQYMAPEQAHGHALDACTDIYQMGVVLFQMLTGSAPYEAPTATSLLYQHAHAPIPSAEAMNASLPQGTDRVIHKALAKEKDQRYRTAGEFALSFATVVGIESPPQIIGFAPTIIEESFIANNTAGEIVDLGGKQTKPPAASSRHRMPRWLLWVGAVFLLVVGILGGRLLWWQREGNEAALETKAMTPVTVGIAETAAITATSKVTTSIAILPSATALESAEANPVSPSLMPSSTETPTRLPLETASAEIRSRPIAMDGIGNSAFDYVDLPFGEIEMNNIPFFLSPEVFKSQASPDRARSLPTSALIPMDITNAQRIHLLLVAGNGFNRYAGDVIGRIEAKCNDSVELVGDLELGRNIREWHAAENVVAYAYEAEEVWHGPIANAPGAIGHIDLVTLELPSACQDGQMTALEIIDSSTETANSLDPALNLIALTVDYYR